MIELAIGIPTILTILGLIWRIASKVGSIDGKVSYIHEKIEKHNKLIERITVLEVKEKIRHGRESQRRTDRNLSSSDD